jgi:HSP20 family protein
MATHNATRPQRTNESERGSERAHDWRHRRGEHDRSSPFSLMRQGIDEMDRWFSRFGTDREWMSPSSWLSSVTGRGDWRPAIEAFTRENEFVVRAEVPGMSRTDLHVETGDDTLTISGERKQEHREEREGVFWTERSYGSFSRVIPLPPGTIADSAKATFNNGVLEVVLQTSSPEARRGRKVDISGQ